ncbi:solute carrier family 22 member 7-like isoform X1 [Chaetodon trifascialis]|uniref:solute carrier family 22 member 7-like isoform X1 n=1 Tax=Chaetodon trifascialis TaxID=109706 RepID=UPI003996676A
MKFDSILSEINGFGKFQIMLIFMLTISRITLPCHFLLNNFMAAVPTHHCNVTALDDGIVFRNLTADQKLAVGIPAEQDGTPSSCRMFSKPQYQHLSGSNSSEDAVTVQCQNGWVYDNSTFKSTLVTEWDLVCSRKGMNKATVTVFFIGVMVGAPIFGFLSDRFGRRPLLMVSYLSSLTFAVFSTLSTSYIMFVIMRFFVGFSLAGISIIAHVLNIEWVGIKHRTFAGVIISLDWTVGNWILVGIAYYVNEWRMLVLAVTSPLILAIITWRWLPESARWLLANGKADAAHHYIMKCAEMNNRAKCMVTITPRALLGPAQAETVNKKYTVIDLFKTPNIRKIAVCSGIVWYGVAFTYYGISLNITGFGLNPYLTQIIFASIEMPMKIGVYVCLDKIGRRPGEVGALLLTGLCLFINIFISQGYFSLFFNLNAFSGFWSTCPSSLNQISKLVPSDKWLIRTVVGVFGKALSEASFTIMGLYTSELYPTVVRQNGLGYTSCLARLGVSVSPLIMLLEDVWHLLPAVIYCTAAVGSGLVASLLPETLNARLTEFIEDVEKPRVQSARRKETQ